MKTSHKENTSENHALQQIGQPSSGRKSTFPPKLVATSIGGALYTERNKAMNGAVQRLHATDDPNIIAIYDANVSDTSATQNLGMDVDMDLPAHKSKILGRSRK